MPTTTYIFGHKNPDADSICAAIAYADIKNRTTDSLHEPARCGNTNARIDAILSQFDQPLPQFIGDVSPRVSDIMTRDVATVTPEHTCAQALELIDQHDVRVLPVVEGGRRLEGYITIFRLGEYFIPKPTEPNRMRHVQTTLGAIVKSLNARVLNLVNEDRLEDLYVRVGAMDVRSFNRHASESGVGSEHSVIVVGDRWDIQQCAIQIGVRLIIITGNLDVDEEVVELAREQGVSLIVSPYDSATTSWITRTATKISGLYETDVITFRPEEKLGQIRRRVSAAYAPAYMVVDDENNLLGIFSRSDMLKPINRRIILVDHNELSQAVDGAGLVEIAEIIDHHRLGNSPTNQPILFINDPVGSTCTIIADLYRKHGLQPEPPIAGVLMSGMISDTLLLQSPTSTAKDAEMLEWLSPLAGIGPQELAEKIFSSGSVILTTTPEQVVRSDMKIYEVGEARFSVSQIEELGFDNFWKHDDAICEAIEQVRESEGLLFSCLLVTDINRQNSLFVIAGNDDLCDAIGYQPLEHNTIFEMPNVVSRKKQLIPYLNTLLKNTGLSEAART